MNKEYWEYYFSKKKKLTDRAFKIRIAMLMCSMVACAAVMASSAFALFTCDIKRNTYLTAAKFDVISWNPVQMQNDELNVTHIVDIETTPGVLGYCRIPVYGANTVRYYFTEAFSSGHIQVKIATAVGVGIGKPEGFWGNPRKYLDAETEILGNGALAVHSHAVPKPEADASSGDGTQSTPPGEGTKVPDDIPTVDIAEEKKETESSSAENSSVASAPVASSGGESSSEGSSSSASDGGGE